jgi:hypothetical protein
MCLGCWAFGGSINANDGTWPLATMVSSAAMAGHVTYGVCVSPGCKGTTFKRSDRRLKSY